MRKNSHLTELVCHAFLRKDKKEALAKFLPEEEAKRNLSCWKDPTQGLNPPVLQLSRVHASWLAPHLRELSTTDITLFLSALSNQQGALLKSSLKLSGAPVKLPPLPQTFLQEKLLNKIMGADILPLECLPPSPLNALLSLQPAHFEVLTKFLGLHDLASEMRHIIDTQKIRKIETFLEEKERSYLKVRMQSEESVVFARMGLMNWKGKDTDLQNLIRQRGCNRLAKALAPEDPSLLWHITHLIDTELALSIKKLATPLENSKAVEILRAQVLEILSFMGVAHE